MQTSTCKRSHSCMQSSTCKHSHSCMQTCTCKCSHSCMQMSTCHIIHKSKFKCVCFIKPLCCLCVAPDMYHFSPHAWKEGWVHEWRSEDNEIMPICSIDTYLRPKSHDDPSTACECAFANIVGLTQDPLPGTNWKIYYSVQVGQGSFCKYFIEWV